MWVVYQSYLAALAFWFTVSYCWVFAELRAIHKSYFRSLGQDEPLEVKAADREVFKFFVYIS
jgi:hypothetical protein